MTLTSLDRNADTAMVPTFLEVDLPVCTYRQVPIISWSVNTCIFLEKLLFLATVPTNCKITSQDDNVDNYSYYDTCSKPQYHDSQTPEIISSSFQQFNINPQQHPQFPHHVSFITIMTLQT